MLGSVASIPSMGKVEEGEGPVQDTVASHGNSGVRKQE